MKECDRVLKPGGKYIQITFGQPHFRKKVLLKPDLHWDLQTQTIGRKHSIFFDLVFPALMVSL